MRPEKARGVIRNAITVYLHNRDPSMLDNPSFLTAIDKLMSKLKIELGESFGDYNKWSPANKDYDGIRHEMGYISDRFNTPARLKWLRYGAVNKLFTSNSMSKE